jgi:hypothetical protein
VNVIAPGVGTRLDDANRQLKNNIPPYKQLDEGVSAAGRHIGSEIQAQIGGVPLEQWIVASRNTALSGAMPIPPEIRQALTGYASEDSMNRVRYKIGDKVVSRARSPSSMWLSFEAQLKRVTHRSGHMS